MDVGLTRESPVSRSSCFVHAQEQGAGGAQGPGLGLPQCVDCAL